MGKLEGKVAFITGAARGQGRSHAIRLAQEGADIIAVDICQQIATVGYPMSTPDDLAETAKQVEALDRRIYAAQADVRDLAALKQAFDAGTAELGPVDIVLANAGIAPMSLHPQPEEPGRTSSTSTSPASTTRSQTAIPRMIERGQGGAIVLTSSTAGINGIGGDDPRRARLHRGQARRRRTDAVLRQHPRQAQHPGEHRAPHRREHADGRQRGHAGVPAAGPDDGQAMTNALPVDLVEPVDISNAIACSSSPTTPATSPGSTLPVDAGFTNKK